MLPFVVTGPSPASAPLEAGPCQLALSFAGGGGDVVWSGGGAISSAWGAEQKENVVEREKVHRVVVGAGVAGTCCAEELCRLKPHHHVTLVTAADVVKVHKTHVLP